jgi:hypothetical protein
MRRSVGDLSMLAHVIAAAVAAASSSACGTDKDAGQPPAACVPDASDILDATPAGSSPFGVVTDAGVPCWNITYRVDPNCCGPQLALVLGCGETLDAASFACGWSVVDPCSTSVDQVADACSSWCTTLAPAGNAFGPGPKSCGVAPSDGGFIYGTCVGEGSGCGFGRPPRRFRARRVRAANATGRALAMAAQMEAASVWAFAALAEDLARLGAPLALLAQARVACLDEARHARSMTRAASRYGAKTPAVRVPTPSVRSMLKLAIENAEEGCIRETFGAAVAVVQGQRARDPYVRRGMRRIARDEVRHAALSWGVQQWLEVRLPPAGRARVAAARSAALVSLDAELRQDTPGDALLGLPNGKTLRAMLGAMRPSLGG